MTKKNFFHKCITIPLVLILALLIGCAKKTTAHASARTEQVNQPGLAYLEPDTVPARIVSLSPAATEILCTLGAFGQIAARTDFCDYPDSVQQLPSVGGFDGQTLSMEKILSFSPDFVYATSGMHDQFFPMLNQQKIPFYISRANSVDSVIAEIEQIGSLTGHTAEADTLTASMKARLSDLRTKYADAPKVPVYWEVWNPPYMSIGRESFINELIEIAGGTNIFCALSEPYPIVSEEAILAAAPRVIVISDAVQDGIVAVQSRPGWQSVPAVKNRRIYAMQTDLFFRPCPRIPAAVELIAKALHAEEAE